MRQVWHRWRNFKVVNLAYEQLLSDGNKSFKYPRDKMARNEALHFAVGDDFREYLESHGVGRPNLEMVGSLACGVCRAPYREYFARNRSLFTDKHGLDAKRPWIFFPENFGAAFYSEREIRRRIRQGMDAASLHEYCENLRRAMLELTSWCQRAAIETEAEVILRPRPATPLKLLAGAVESNLGRKLAPRFHIIKDKSVRDWILASDFTVSNYSSSLVEAAVADKPTALLLPFSLPASMHCEWHEHTTQIASCDEFLALARNPLAASASLKQWAEGNLLGYGDPIANAAETIASVVDGRRTLPRVTPPGTVRRMSEWLRRHFRAHKKRLRTSAVKPGGKGIDFFEGDRFDDADVAARTDAWNAVLSDKVRHCPGAAVEEQAA
jgi:hypothetical protein